MLLFVNASSQETVTLKFNRPSNYQGSMTKIRIIILDNEYTLKNGSSISVNINPPKGKSIRIDCRAGLGGQTSFSFIPTPNQTYEFEVGFKTIGLYIDLLTGDQAGTDNLNDANAPSQSESVRDEWLKKGGKIYYVSVLLTGTYIGMDIDGVGKMNGYGGGYSFFMNSINLKMPEYKTGSSNWKSFNWGFGYDLVINNFKFKMPATSGVKVDMNSTYLNIMITGNFGYTWGFGKYIDEATWRGVAVTLKYKPSYNLSLVTSTITTTMPPMPPVFPNGYTKVTTNSESSGSFNAGGFGFDIDFNKFSATAAKLAPKPRTKFSFFVLPPIGDNPLFVSASIGVLFYPPQGGSRAMKRYK